MGAFAIAFTTLSMSLMEWRSAAITNAYIGNCFFTAGMGLVLVAQWELVRGNSFGHTVFGGFGEHLVTSSYDLPCMMAVI